MHNLPNNQLYCRTLAKTLNSGSLACDPLFNVNRCLLEAPTQTSCGGGFNDLEKV